MGEPHFTHFLSVLGLIFNHYIHQIVEINRLPAPDVELRQREIPAAGCERLENHRHFGLAFHEKFGDILPLMLYAQRPMTNSFNRLIDATVWHGGKIHLAKDQALTSAQFYRVYPRYRDLLEIKRRLDPVVRNYRFWLGKNWKVCP
jgi:FAD/FMN-containing dehydrogenase